MKKFISVYFIAFSTSSSDLGAVLRTKMICVNKSFLKKFQIIYSQIQMMSQGNHPQFGHLQFSERGNVGSKDHSKTQREGMQDRLRVLIIPL